MRIRGAFISFIARGDLAPGDRVYERGPFSQSHNHAGMKKFLDNQLASHLGESHRFKILLRRSIKFLTAHLCYDPLTHLPRLCKTGNVIDVSVGILVSIEATREPYHLLWGTKREGDSCLNLGNQHRTPLY